MPKQTKPEETSTTEKRVRKPSPARQTLLDASEGRETVLRFDTSEIAKGSAYGWWGARRRAGLTEKVAINLDTKAMTVTIGPRNTDAPAEPEQIEDAPELPSDESSAGDAGDTAIATEGEAEESEAPTNEV